MKTEPRSSAEKRKAALMFLVFLTIMILLLVFEPQFFWIPLPFVLTYAVLALDKM